MTKEIFGNKVSLNRLVSILKDNFPDLRVFYRKERKGDVLESQNDPSVLLEFFPNVKPLEFEDALQATIEWYKVAKSKDFFSN